MAIGRQSRSAERLCLPIRHAARPVCNTAGNAETEIAVRVYGQNEDENGNHMIDYYETASKQGEDCMKNSDCDSSDGKEKGFCDSFIEYKCSVKCTEDAQCANPAGSKYHFVCREDGRCTPDGAKQQIR